MSYQANGQSIPQNYRQHASRRQNDYHYQAHPPHPNPYQYQYHHPQQYQLHPMQHYQQQWYPSYQPYVPQHPRQFQPQFAMMPPAPMHTPNNVPPRPVPVPQPLKTPHQDSAPSTASAAVTSPSVTPSNTSLTTNTPPVSTPKQTSQVPAPAPPESPVSDVSQAVQRVPFYPKLPWLSAESFPASSYRRRRKKTQNKPDEKETEDTELKIAEAVVDAKADGTINQDDSPETPVQAPETQDDAQAEASTPLQEAVVEMPITADTITSKVPDSQARAAVKQVIPVIPYIPNVRIPAKPAQATAKVPELVVNGDAQAASEAPTVNGDEVKATTATEDTAVEPAEDTKAVAAPVKAAPKSWAGLFTGGVNTTSSTDTLSQTLAGQRSNNMADLVKTYNVQAGMKLQFLEPRGLVNTGNMCYMNSILQSLIFCVPFYDFLDQVGKKAAHHFKSDTPLLEAMIMFMREYNVIESATTTTELRRRLKDNQLEQYGEAFIPEYVYEVIKKLPRFSSMRQDAEEFLGFLLEGLHDECALFSNNNEQKKAQAAANEQAADGWLEVGPKQRAAVTRSSGESNSDTPIAKIFGGKLRSVLRVPGLKDSVTLEPYQALQLDIGSQSVNNITDALKGLTRPETLHGEFNSPRGPSTTATKQVFIETLPPVLILHLKRFQYDNTGGTQKIWKKIGYPLELQIPKESLPQHKRAVNAKADVTAKYRLISVVYHHGKSASGGHYTADVRRQEDSEWIRIDDTNIRRIRADTVAAEGAEEDNQEKSDGTATPKSSHELDGEDSDNGGWSQVNGQASQTAKKNSALSPTKQNFKHHIKDNKVAYILFYQRIGI